MSSGLTGRQRSDVFGFVVQPDGPVTELTTMSGVMPALTDRFSPAANRGVLRRVSPAAVSSAPKRS